jgi:hypothetical protein
LYKNVLWPAVGPQALEASEPIAEAVHRFVVKAGQPRPRKYGGPHISMGACAMPGADGVAMMSGLSLEISAAPASMVLKIQGSHSTKCLMLTDIGCHRPDHRTDEIGPDRIGGDRM